MGICAHLCSEKVMIEICAESVFFKLKYSEKDWFVENIQKHAGTFVCRYKEKKLHQVLTFLPQNDYN